MPPKKKAFESLSDSSRSRRLFTRGLGRNPVIAIECNTDLFASHNVGPVDDYRGRKKLKKPKNPTTVHKVFLNDSDVDISVDDEDAGKFVEVDNENDTLLNNKVNQLKNQQDSDDDFSLEIYQNGVRVHIVDASKGKVEPHQNQPLNRPSAEEKDEDDNYGGGGGCNYIRPAIPIRRPMPKLEKPQKLTGYQKFRKSILVVNSKRHNQSKMASKNMSFRVFNKSCLAAEKSVRNIENVGETEKVPEAEISMGNSDKRLTIFSYTPVRGVAYPKTPNPRLSSVASSSSNAVLSPFLPPEASTPIEKTSKQNSRFSKFAGLSSLNLESGEHVEKSSEDHTPRQRLSSPSERSSGLETAKVLTPRRSEVREEYGDNNDKAETSGMAPTQSDTSLPSESEAVPDMELDEDVESVGRGRPSSARRTRYETRSSKSGRFSTNTAVAMDSEEDEESTSERRSPTPRAADCSLTEMIVSSDEEKYKRKRSRKTNSPAKEEEIKSQETLQFNDGTSIMPTTEIASCSTMIQQTNVDTLMEDLETAEKENQQATFVDDVAENNKRPKARNTIQPQQRQLLREARLSTMTTASSRRESLNSLMSEISLDDLDLDAEDGENKTIAGSEAHSRAESRAQTAMTIHLDDVSELPFYLADISAAVEDVNDMDQLLHVVKQKEPMSWSDIPKSVFFAKNVKKLGEGSYGEVFATIYDGKPVAIKVVPFEPDPNFPIHKGFVNGSVMPSCSSVLPEVVVMKELTGLCNMESENSSPNFINLIASHVVRGNYPNGLLKAWDAFAKVKESLNDRPSDYSSQKQCFITFVTENGGTDLEAFQVKSEEEIRSILIQLLLSLLVAEKELEFEHRDLHLGNVLIARIEDEKLSYKFNGSKITVKSHGVKANIIDFTLSRIKKGITTVFQNLENDPEMFQGQGNDQFEVYRKMRENNCKDWRDFQPVTNLWWVEYLANQMIQPPICPKGVLSAAKRKKLQELFNRMGKFKECGEVFTDEDFYTGFCAGYLDHDS